MREIGGRRIDLGMVGPKVSLVTSLGVYEIGMIPWDRAAEGV